MRSALGELLRDWRTARGYSQLALAARAGVSARHLETGRARPSRDMVLLLGEALEVPLRERNTLLEAAGFAPVFAETPLDAPEMEHVRRALAALLAAHASSPAVVVNRRCDILMSNPAAVRLMERLVPEALGKESSGNLVRLLFAPDGARPYIENWEEVALEMASRILRETAHEDARALLAEALGPDGLVPPLSATRAMGRTAAVALPIRIRRGDLRIDLWSTVTTLGTPLDVTLQELRIESLFPADADSERALAAIVSGTPAP